MSAVARLRAATRDRAMRAAVVEAEDVRRVVEDLDSHRTRADAAEAECARLRVDLEATERARQAAEEERDTALELVAPDAMEVARQRDARDAERLHALVVARVALADAEADRDRLTGELTAVRRAVRTLDGARAAIDANGQRVLRSLAGEERAALLEELAVARRERDDWNARATAMEAERDEARAALADNDLILEQRERQLTAALTFVAEERARCATVCREVVARYRSGACGCAECEGRRDGARECAEAIERGEAGR